MLAEIDEDYQQEALTALIWLSYAERPLMVDELAEALIVNPKSIPSVNTENRLLDPLYVLDILGSLVTVSLAGSSEPKLYVEVVNNAGLRPHTRNSEVRFAHFSVKEFLLSDAVRNATMFKVTIDHFPSHFFLVGSCLQYIIHCHNDPSGISQSVRKTMPLISYACQQWHVHLKKLSETAQISLEALVLSMFTTDGMFSLWTWISKPYTPRDECTPLPWACNLGLVSVVKYLLDHGAEVDVWSDRRGTALCRAAGNGHVEIVKILLEHGADISKAETGEQETALHQAAAGGFDEVVQILVDAGAQPSAKDHEDLSRPEGAGWIIWYILVCI